MQGYIDSVKQLFSNPPVDEKANVLVKLNQTKSKVEGDHKFLNDSKEWLQGISPGASRDHKAFKELKRNYDSKITHAGLVYYLHYCWGKEIGCVIRPDMFWYTIVSEIASLVLGDPAKYKHLFSNSAEKIAIITVPGDATEINVEDVTNKMKEQIANKEFMDTICDTRFASEVPLANYAIKMAFCCMGTPYFDYFTTKCGIPVCDVQGGLEDWSTLHNAVGKLQAMKLPNLDKYLARVSNVVANVIYFAYGKQLPNLKKLYSSKEKFFSNIFHYGENPLCMSGHPDEIVQGWIQQLYHEYHDEMQLNEFPAHINYVPYEYIGSEPKQRYCQAVTLAYSLHNKEKNVLEPHYGIIKYEILNEKTYKQLAKQQ